MDEIFDKMIGGEAAVGVYYSGDAITMIDDNPDLAWVFPEEGTVLSVDSMAIPATSEHEEAAEMFINFMCEPDVGKANIEYIATPPLCTVYGRFWMKTSSTARSRTPPRTLRPKKRCSLP